MWSTNKSTLNHVRSSSVHWRTEQKNMNHRTRMLLRAVSQSLFTSQKFKKERTKKNKKSFFSA